MQNRYFGDVGDFGKYGLLRILTGLNDEPKLRLGVVWYLYQKESHNSDGKHISYLQKNGQDFRECDPLLYDLLRTLLIDAHGSIIEANRQVSHAETTGILPAGTSFYGESLSYAAGLSFSTKLALRKDWFSKAFTKTASADLVFVDPDNGIECVSVPRTRSKGPKYVFWDDVDAFFQRGQTTIIYHHLNRHVSHGSHVEQVETKQRQIRERYGNDFEAYAITFKRGTSRAYFVIASPQNKKLLQARLERMMSGPWGRHFSLHENE